MQAPILRGYPIYVKAFTIPSWQDADMEPKFDTELVRATMKAQNVSQTDLAKALGFTSQSAISNIFKTSGKPRRVQIPEAIAIYRFLGLGEFVPQTPQTDSFPIIGFSGASSWREAVQMPLGSMSIPPKKAGPRSFAVEVQGDSLDKVVQPGEYVVVDPDQKELVVGKCYLVQNKDHETSLKCYARNPARFEPASSNSSHEAIPASDVESVVGRLVWRGGSL